MGARKCHHPSYILWRKFNPELPMSLDDLNEQCVLCRLFFHMSTLRIPWSLCWSINPPNPNVKWLFNTWEQVRNDVRKQRQVVLQKFGHLNSDPTLTERMGVWEGDFPRGYSDIPILPGSLTARPWKMMVGRHWIGRLLSFRDGNFSGASC